MPALKRGPFLHLKPASDLHKLMHCALLPFLYKSTLDSSNAFPLSLQFRYEPRRADSPALASLTCILVLRDPKISSENRLIPGCLKEDK